MITDKNGVIYSDDMKNLIDGTQCNAPIYSIPGGVETIEASAFDGNTMVEMLILPSSLTTLSLYSFARMSELELVRMENSMIEDIEPRCFVGSRKLKCVEFPIHIKYIGLEAFRGTALEKIDITTEFMRESQLGRGSFMYSEVKEAVVSDVRASMFFGCEKLERLTVVDGAIEIEYNACKGCVKLKELHLPDSIETIGKEAFVDSPIEELTMPQNLVNLGDMAFRWGRVKKVFCNSPYLIVENGVLYDAGKVQLYGCWSDTVDNIDRSIKFIQQGAFIGNNLITEIDLQWLGYIPNDCFREMGALKTVRLDVHCVSSRAFMDCISLTDVSLGNCQSCGEYCFIGCKKLIKFESRNLRAIYGHCFDGCQQLPNLAFDELTYVGEYAFNGCSAITKLQLRDPNYYIETLTLKRRCFAGMSGLKEIDLPEGVRELNHVFNDCVSLEKVKLPGTIYKISFGSLGSNCPNLKEILIPKGLLTRFKGMFKAKYHSLLKEY